VREFCRKCDRGGAKVAASKCEDHCQECDGTGEVGSGGNYGQDYFGCGDCGGNGEKHIVHRDPSGRFMFRHPLKAKVGFRYQKVECGLCSGEFHVVKKRRRRG